MCGFIHCERGQGARIPLQLLHQLQAAEGHVTVIGRRIDAESTIGTPFIVLQEIWKRFVKDANFLVFIGGYENYGVEVA
jgi:hypothetical protein